MSVSISDPTSSQLTLDVTDMQGMLAMAVSLVFVIVTTGYAADVKGMEVSVDPTQADRLIRQAEESLPEKPAAALEYARLALALCRELDYGRGTAQAFRLMAASLAELGRTDSALTHFRQALDAARQTDDTLTVALVLNELAGMFRHTGDYDQAIDHIVESMELSLALRDTVAVAAKLMNAGLLYMDTGDLKKAKEFIHKAIAVRIPDSNFLLRARMRNALGEIYKKCGELDEALGCYLLAASYYERAGNRFGSALVNGNIGEVYSLKRAFAVANDYYRRSLDELNESATGREYEGILRSLMASNFLATGDVQMCLAHAHKAYSQGKELAFVHAVLEASKVLSEAYERTGNYAEAVRFYKEYKAVSDSLVLGDRETLLAGLQQRVDAQQTEAEIKRIRRETAIVELDSQVLLMTLCLLLVATLLSVYVWKLRSLRSAEKLSHHVLVLQLQADQLRHNGQELRRRVDAKEESLNSQRVQLERKNVLLEELNGNIDELNTRSDHMVEDDLKTAYRILDQLSYVDREWEDFKLTFENVNSTFLQKIKTLYPDVTHSELKLCALLKMKLSMKEAAGVLGVAPNTVKTARYRLRKKFNLDGDDSLGEFIANL